MPVNVAQKTTSGYSFASSYSVTLPSTGAVAGDMYIVFLAQATSSSLTTSSTGWSKLGQWTNGSQATFAAFTGLFGTAGALTVNTSITGAAASIAFRINQAWSTQSWVNGTAVTGSGSPNSNASLTPTLGTRQYLWIVANCNSTSGPGSAPSGWGDFTTQGDGSGTTTLVSSDLVATAGSETPGSWGSGGGGVAYVSNTFAIPGLPSAPRNPNNNFIVTQRASLY